jgi:hypothetical protein
MPIPVRNNWSFNAAALEDAQLQTAAEVGNVAAKIETLIQSQPDAGVIMDQLGALTESASKQVDVTAAGFKEVCGRLGDTTKAIGHASTQIDLVAGDLTRMANYAQTIARHFDDQGGRDAELCTAFYAAAVDIDGHIDARTRLGTLLIEAKYDSLADFGDRGEFIERVQRVFKDQQGQNKELADFVTPEVLGCVWERAKGVTKALKRLNPDRSKKAGGSKT